MPSTPNHCLDLFFVIQAAQPFPRQARPRWASRHVSETTQVRLRRRPRPNTASSLVTIRHAENHKRVGCSLLSHFRLIGSASLKHTGRPGRCVPRERAPLGLVRRKHEDTSTAYQEIGSRRPDLQIRPTSHCATSIMASLVPNVTKFASTPRFRNFGCGNTIRHSTWNVQVPVPEKFSTIPRNFTHLSGKPCGKSGGGFLPRRDRRVSAVDYDGPVKRSENCEKSARSTSPSSSRSASTPGGQVAACG